MLDLREETVFNEKFSTPVQKKLSKNGVICAVTHMGLHRKYYSTADRSHCDKDMYLLYGYTKTIQIYSENQATLKDSKLVWDLGLGYTPFGEAQQAEGKWSSLGCVSCCE